MPKLPNWTFPVVGLIAVFGVIVSRADYTPPSRFAEAATSQTAAVDWSDGQDGAAANGEEHWLKHGGDFPEYRDSREYERGAEQFVSHPPPGTLAKHRANGDIVYFDPASGDFAVVNAQGKPRTFFRPRHGQAYWDRQ